MALSSRILPSEIRNEIYGYFWCDVKVQIDVSHMPEDADLNYGPATVDDDKTKQPLPCLDSGRTEQRPVDKRPLIFMQKQHSRQFVHTAILRTCRQIYSEAIPFLYESICLSYSPRHCLSATEQHGRGFRFPVRHLPLIEHLRLTFNRKAKHLDLHMVIKVIHNFSMPHCSLKRLDLGFNSSPESENSRQEPGLTAPFHNTTTHAESWVPWTCTIGTVNGEIHMELSDKVAFCQDVGLLARSILVVKGWRCDALIWEQGREWNFDSGASTLYWGWSLQAAAIHKPISTSASIPQVDRSTPARADDDSASS
jgi:hypothetical protein